MIIHVPIHLTLANKLFLSSKINIDPLLVSKKNVYGMFIYNMLSKPNFGKLGDEYKRDHKYDQVITVQIPELIFNTKGIHISDRANHTFNLFLRRLLLDDFHTYMDFHFKLNRTPLRQAIMDWMLKNNLHEDALALRTLEKDYERYRKFMDLDSGENRIFA